MNIICILAGGVGNRFGSPVPKQYHLIDGRTVIDYVIEAAIKSAADEILVVTDEDHVGELKENYGVMTVTGGEHRNDSIVRAIDYVERNLKCEKMIIVDAVCPMVKADLFNQFFDYLDEYDVVFTAGDITTSLARFDGEPVNRRDYFLIETPDAYRFDVLKKAFSAKAISSTPLHMLPEDAKIKFYHDFKDYMKVVYPHDLAVASALMKERKKIVRFEAHADRAVLNLLAKLRKVNRSGAREWEKRIDKDMERLFAQWEIHEFSVNRDGYTGLVLECSSRKYGNVVLKMYPPFLKRRYIKESFVMSNLKAYPQATVIALDPGTNTMLLKRVVPGDYISYLEDREAIAAMFVRMYENRLLVAKTLSIPADVKGVMELTLDEYETAKQYDFYPELMKRLVEQAKQVYDKHFAADEKCVLHGDAYFKNALRSEDGIQVIDPVGYQDAFIFEYMPFLTYELVLHAEPGKYREAYQEQKAFFGEFTDVSRFDEATFVFLVKQMVPSVYEANDGYKRANGYLNLIRDLYIDEDSHIIV